MLDFSDTLEYSLSFEQVLELAKNKNSDREPSKRIYFLRYDNMV